MPTALVAGNSGTKFRPTLRDSLTTRPLDLTHTVCTLRLNRADGVSVDRTMTILSPPTAGCVDYLFAPADLVVGTLKLEITVKDAANLEITSVHVYRYKVRSRLASPTP